MTTPGAGTKTRSTVIVGTAVGVAAGVLTWVSARQHQLARSATSGTDQVAAPEPVRREHQPGAAVDKGATGDEDVPEWEDLDTIENLSRSWLTRTLISFFGLSLGAIVAPVAFVASVVVPAPEMWDEARERLLASVDGANALVGTTACLALVVTLAIAIGLSLAAPADVPPAEAIPRALTLRVLAATARGSAIVATWFALTALDDSVVLASMLILLSLGGLLCSASIGGEADEAFRGLARVSARNVAAALARLTAVDRAERYQSDPTLRRPLSYLQWLPSWALAPVLAFQGFVFATMIWVQQLLEPDSPSWSAYAAAMTPSLPDLLRVCLLAALTFAVAESALTSSWRAWALGRTIRARLLAALSFLMCASWAALLVVFVVTQPAGGANATRTAIIAVFWAIPVLVYTVGPALFFFTGRGSIYAWRRAKRSLATQLEVAIRTADHPGRRATSGIWHGQSPARPPAQTHLGAAPQDDTAPDTFSTGTSSRTAERSTP